MIINFVGSEPDVLVGDLSPGTPFWYSNQLWIKIDLQTYNCVRLSDGTSKLLDAGRSVVKAKAKIVAEKE